MAYSIRWRNAVWSSCGNLSCWTHTKFDRHALTIKSQQSLRCQTS